MRFIVPGVAALVLSGCTTLASAPPTSAPQTEERTSSQAPASSAEKATRKPSSPLLPSAFFADGAEAFIAWRCTPAQDLITAFPDNRLRLWSSQGHYQLERAVVASGERYAKADLSFWNKGDEATVESANGRLECQQDTQRKTWTRDQHPDTIFYARGNEPGWTLRLDRETSQLSWVTDYGKRALTLPYGVASIVNGQQARMTLVSQDPAQPLTVEMEARACFDDMSGKPYPVRVTLTSGSDQWRGCGQGIEKRK
ncbi:Membrane-bound lysozyme-inhibitor of c-type lysozyme [Modicisalibacter ilicicola DSM 19980]|uniref:Membrane-bound lysozyme-inhibitor of c-type lysozyme n=1 Tax=Modicisalibacter ilicicola DSM 19980 TaxID=1121942 RepID=A0A1M5ETZ7_9GAMM|nr:MliC family protein [Halomonas ilicicola]SHF82659.1 Membrane-bound lysozyme-inhibitor of c-type lysozyme [Halomonas ilicicola DSM 19980]